MCRMSFFASSISSASQEIQNRSTDLKDLHSRGFRSVVKANHFLRLGREISYLTTPLIVQPITNLYYVDNSSDDIMTVVAALVAEVDKIRDNCLQNPVCADPAFTIAQYFTCLRTVAYRADLDAQAIEYRVEMDSLLAEAAKNLDRETESTSSVSSSGASSSGGFFSSLFSSLSSSETE